MKLIHVTKLQIRSGKRWNIRACPIAKAISQAYPHSFVVASHVDCCIDTNNYPLPAVAKKFAFDFDHGKAVRPIKFWI